MENQALFYSDDNVRCRLFQSNEGADMNWLCFPGGPGGDASYYTLLLKHVTLPGKVWLIDFPGNGDHAPEFTEFDRWFDFFLPFIKHFSNPAIIGHSFGAMLPLYFPELEDLLSAFVVLNSSPSLWVEEALKVAQARSLPNYLPAMEAFAKAPGDDTFKNALLTCAPYYFPEETLEEGKQILLSIPFNYNAPVWFQTKAMTEGFDAKWVPQDVPTLIVGGEYDAITPYSIYEQDTRFHRDNISMHFIKGAGHFPVLEKPAEFSEIVQAFAAEVCKAPVG